MSEILNEFGIDVPEKDVRRLMGMAKAAKVDPSKVEEFIDYAYGLGYCQGRTITAQQFLKTIDERSEPQLGEEPKS